MFHLYYLDILLTPWILMSVEWCSTMKMFLQLIPFVFWNLLSPRKVIISASFHSVSKCQLSLTKYPFSPHLFILHHILLIAFCCCCCSIEAKLLKLHLTLRRLNTSNLKLSKRLLLSFHIILIKLLTLCIFLIGNLYFAYLLFYYYKQIKWWWELLQTFLRVHICFFRRL